MAFPGARFVSLPRAIRLAIAVSFIVLVAGLWAISSVPAGTFYDDGIYIGLGKALAQGQGLRYLNLPGAPAATHYPPGYPALLALCWILGGELTRVVLFAKVANAILMAIGAGGLTWLLAEGGPDPTAAAIGVVTGAIAVPVLALSTIPFSEPLFLACLVGAAILTRRAAKPEAGIRAWALTGLGWGLLFLVRTVGGVMIPVGGLILMRHAGRKAVVVALAAALLVSAPWLVWSGQHASEVPAILGGSYGSYLGWYLESLALEGPGLMGRIAAHNVTALLRPLSVLLAPPGPSWLGWITLPAGLVILTVGAVALWRAAAVLAGTLALYLVVVIVWPYPPDRFIWGIWPVVTATLAAGFVLAWRGRGTAAGWRSATLVVLLAAAIGTSGYLYRQGLGVAGRAWEGPQRSGANAMAPAVRWVQRHAPPGAIIATVDDPMLALYTGHPSVPALAWSAAEHGREQSVDTAEANLVRILDRYRPAMIILPGGGTPEAFAVERLWRSAKRLELIDTIEGGGAVFRPVRPDSSR